MEKNKAFYSTIGLILLSFVWIGVLPTRVLETEAVDPAFGPLSFVLTMVFLALLWINGYYFQKMRGNK